MRFRIAALAPLLLMLALAPPAAGQEATPAAPDTAAAPAPAPARRRGAVEPAPRRAWTFGGGLGWISARPDGGLPLTSEDASGLGAQLRIGNAVHPDYVLGIEMVAFHPSPDDTTEWTVLAAGPSLTWYAPKNFYVRGMAGWGYFKEKIVIEARNIDFATWSDDDFAFLIAGGWEYRYRRRLGISPQLEYLHIGVRRPSHEIVGASVQVNWYY